MIEQQKIDGPRIVWRVLLVWLGALALVALLYAGEGLRARHNWERFKHDLEARGAELDWAAYTPPPVPDDQNVFKAPKMAEWFAGRGATSLSTELNHAAIPSFVPEQNAAIELVIVPTDAAISPGNEDRTLQFNNGILTRAVDHGGSSTNSASHEIIAQIMMDDVLLRDAIRNLAIQGGLNYTLDPAISNDLKYTVTLRWTNVTAEHGLMALLSNFNLRWIPDPKTGIARITLGGPGAKVWVDPQAAELIRAALANLSGRSTPPARLVRTSSGIVLQAATNAASPPVRLFVRTEYSPNLNRIAEFFPRDRIPPPVPDAGPVHVVSSSSNSFLVYPNSPTFAAADYLEWSDQFQPDFDLIRDALKRPFARVDGDYSNPDSIPFQNYVTLRVLAQTLSQRAQCYLLLNDPTNAVRELALLHGLNRLCCAETNQRPVTLVGAMIKSAITGLYVAAVAQGFELQVWREPQLPVLQDQLRDTDLLGSLVAAMKTEQASVCRIIERSSPSKIANGQLAILGGTSTLWQRFRSPVFLYLTFAPRSSVYEDMKSVLTFQQRTIDCMDLPSRTIAAGDLDIVCADLDRKKGQHGTHSILTSIFSANFLRAWQTAAMTQTEVNEAFVACALERCRLAEGSYPEKLDTLVPRYAAGLPHEIIGGGPLHYRRTNAGEFQLYSAGWSGRDGGGKAILSANAHQNLDRGDWVWPPPGD